MERSIQKYIPNGTTLSDLWANNKKDSYGYFTVETRSLQEGCSYSMLGCRDKATLCSVFEMASVWGESRTEGWLLLCVGRKQAPRSSATSVCSSSSSGILPPHSQMREQWILISSRLLYSINSFAFDSQYLPFSLCWPFSLFPRFINMGKNRKLNWTWKKTVIEFGLCYVEFLLDLFLPLKIAMCSSGVSEGSRLLQSFVPPCGEGGDTHRKTALINGTSKAVVIYQTRSIY